MEAKLLTREQRNSMYENHLSKDFHQDEVKSQEMIEQMILDEKYICYGFFQENQPQGYAYLIKAQGDKAILLDYLVVFEENRSKGYGSVFLTILKEELAHQYKYLLAEVENPAFSHTEKDKNIRERRIAFYKKNQFGISKVKSRVIKDDYNIIYLPLGATPSNEDIFSSMTHIYPRIFGEDYWNKNIKVDPA
ncbi:MAG: GNAT family N-acetyltransferase [Acetivibrio sp.]